jgi:hypothetical protein
VVLEFLTGTRVNKDGERGASSQLQAGWSFRFWLRWMARPRLQRNFVMCAAPFAVLCVLSSVLALLLTAAPLSAQSMPAAPAQGAPSTDQQDLGSQATDPTASLMSINFISDFEMS